MRRDGNCLPNAVVGSSTDLGLSTHTVPTMRQLTQDVIDEHFEYFRECYGEGETVYLTNYITRMGRWYRSPHIRALAIATRRDILVIQVASYPRMAGTLYSGSVDVREHGDRIIPSNRIRALLMHDVVPVYLHQSHFVGVGRIVPT